jgi:GNAT superfamily N-acetyltransferase
MIWKRSADPASDVVRDAVALDDKIIKVGVTNVSKHTWWVAYDQGQPVAYCGAYTIRLRTGNRVVMSRAGVLPAYRRNGLHAKMIQLRESWAASRGCDTASARVNAVYNVRAMESMIRNGYRIGRRRGVWALMTKRLERTYVADVRILARRSRVQGGERVVCL